jgi:alginate biosynthesis protein AlgX
MGRQLKLLMMHVLAAAIAAAMLLAVSPSARAEPNYTVERCCDLCPQAANRAAYTTRFLQSFTTLVQGKDGWLFRTDDDLRTSFGPDAEGLKSLKRLNAALKSRGVELVMVYQPSRGLMHADKLPASARKQYNVEAARQSYTQALNRFRNIGITVPPLERLLNQKNTADEYFYRGDHHWTPEGARATALLTAEAIRGMKQFAGIPQKKFSTERVGIWGKRGTMQKAATQLCGNGYPDQYAPRFVTSAEGGGDLFADEGAPEITLVGTSNSDSAYNFAGFLSESLGVDILNESVAGGGHEGALLQYLPSPAFQKTPPKVLVWELETYHNLSKGLFYRQVIPLVKGGCAGRKPQLSRTVALKGDSTETLFNGGGAVQNLRSRDHVLDVRFSDPGVKQFKGIVWYSNGSKETISIEHSDYIETGGHFTVELRDDPEWADRVFLSLDVLRTETIPAGTSVTAQICSRDDAAAGAAPDKAPEQAPAKKAAPRKNKA